MRVDRTFLFVMDGYVAAQEILLAVIVEYCIMDYYLNFVKVLRDCS